MSEDPSDIVVYLSISWDNHIKVVAAILPVARSNKNLINHLQDNPNVGIYVRLYNEPK